MRFLIIRISVAIASGMFVLAVSGVSASLWAQDLHAGYYYPEPQSSEVYPARVDVLPNADRRTRIAFVTGMAAQQARNPYPPAFHLFAKGDRAEKFILVAAGGDRYNTLYRLRALLASLTAMARATPVFLNQSAPEYLTFLDLCKMLGVELLTVTDGDKIAHQFVIQ